jgi:anti-sigma factor RsiW
MIMNCTDIHSQLDDYLDKTLDLSDAQAFDAHLQSCSECQQLLKESNSLILALQNLPVDEADAGFEERVLKKVHRQFPNQGNKRFFTGFATAMAASLALWFASTVYIPEMPDTQSPTIQLAVNDAYTVNLKFEAPANLSDVTLSITLPEHVEITGYPGRKAIIWKTTLDKGSNVLALPVMAINNGQGELIAHLQYGDKSKSFRVVLKTNLNDAWALPKNIQLPTA